MDHPGSITRIEQTDTGCVEIYHQRSGHAVALYLYPDEVAQLAETLESIAADMIDDDDLEVFI